MDSAYERAVDDYEAAVLSGDPQRRAEARAAMQAAAEAWLGRMRKATVPSFEALLADPTVQVDPKAEVLAAIYPAVVLSDTADAKPPQPDAALAREFGEPP